MFKKHHKVFAFVLIFCLVQLWILGNGSLEVLRWTKNWTYNGTSPPLPPSSLPSPPPPPPQPPPPNVTQTVHKHSRPLIFHLIHSTDVATFRRHNVRAIESIFYHHPKAKVVLYVNRNEMKTLPPPLLRMHDERGYDLTMEEYNWKDLIRSALTIPNHTIQPKAALQWTKKISMYQKSKFWYSHQTDGVRLLLLYTKGGIYMDTDMIIVKPLDSLQNVVGRENRGQINGAVLIFDKGNPFLADCINEYFSTFRPRSWTYNGPLLLTRVLQREPYSSCQNLTRRENETATSSTSRCSPSSNDKKCMTCPVTVLEQAAFYPMQWFQVTETCFKEHPNVSEVKAQIEASSYIVHTNNKASNEYWEANSYRTTPNTLCHWLYNTFCIFCDDAL